MADEDRSFDPRQTETNRSREQGGGMGARELNQQRDPNRHETATAPDRTEPFDTSLDPTTNAVGSLVFGVSIVLVLLVELVLLRRRAGRPA